MINQKNVKYISKNIEEKIQGPYYKNKIIEILDINVNENIINEILNSNDISYNDKLALKNFDFSKMENIVTLPDSIIKIILKDSNYNGIINYN